ncbi:hypothetical protein CN503_26855 [Bacillus cereus]|nr:hypothetical protein CON43_23930 [Bacillus cereus]PER59776.1 hypothetical protein CN503_26855 [Bacillus cereus]PEU01077.1 hypothetical protein CN534_09915 [Bacillus cereus]PEW64871.1 hypothetical protein CN443_02725 [Bacillus cereus]PEY82512.1 hypothetical protein CN353_31070 [Bacillus cereus]
MYRQSSEECIWDCIMKGGHRFECETICNMHPSISNYYGYSPHSIPTTYVPITTQSMSLSSDYTPYSMPKIYPIAVDCYAQCIRNGHSPWYCQNACREHHW